MLGTWNTKFRLNPDLDSAPESKTSEWITGSSNREYSECYPFLAISDVNMFRVVWTFVISTALIYVATLLPYRIAFIEFHVPTEVDEPVGWNVVVLIVDIVFLSDLVLNFFFTYRDSFDREVRCLRRIGIRYVCGGPFLIDLLSCLPPALLQLILTAILGSDTEQTSVHKSGWLMKIHRIPRLAKLVRIFRLVKIMNLLRKYAAVERIRNNRAIRVMYFVLGFCLIAHIVACGWYLVAALHDELETSWIYRRYDSEVRVLESSPQEDWLHSMYFVLTVFTTVGFGDISAFTVGEMVYAIFAMIIGTMANGVIMGEMINSIAFVDLVSAERNEQTKLLESFSEHTQLKEDVSLALINFMTKTQDVHRTYERQQIKLLIMRNVFPRDLEKQVPNALFHGQLLQNRLFTNCRRLGPVPFQLPLFVALAVHQKFMVSGDLAYDAGDQPNSIHLVLTGVFAALARRRMAADSSTVRRMAADGDVELTAKREGRYVKIGELYPAQLCCQRSYFGDMEIMQDIITRRDAVRCESDGSTMLVIEKHDIAELTTEFPRHMLLLRKAAMRRWQRRMKMQNAVPHERPYLQHTDLAAWSIQKHWLLFQLRKEQSNEPPKDNFCRSGSCESRIENYLNATELQEAGKVTKLTAGTVKSAVQHMLTNLPGRKHCRQDDIFTPSIQSEVDLVRTDLGQLSGEVSQLRTDVSAMNAKLDKVTDILSRLDLSGRPLTL